jgi:hypothetical protein
LRRAEKQGFFNRSFSGCGFVGLAYFRFIFFGNDPKKKQKKSRTKDAASALFLRLEKLKKTSKRFFCFSTAPKFTPPPARLLPEATAHYKVSFYVPSAFECFTLVLSDPRGVKYMLHAFNNSIDLREVAHCVVLF